MHSPPQRELKTAQEAVQSKSEDLEDLSQKMREKTRKLDTVTGNYDGVIKQRGKRWVEKELVTESLKIFEGRLSKNLKLNSNFHVISILFNKFRSTPREMHTLRERNEIPEKESRLHKR